MDYKKKSLKKLDLNKSYEEIDSRLASGWYVDSNGDNTSDGSLETPFETIARAINASSDGDTIRLNPGVYTGDIDFGGKIFPVTRDSINKYWMKAKKKAGVTDLMWRDLRRTGITWMFEKKGLSVPEVQVISGHKNPLVLLNTYTQLNPTKIAQKI